MSATGVFQFSATWPGPSELNMGPSECNMGPSECNMCP